MDQLRTLTLPSTREARLAQENIVEVYPRLYPLELSVQVDGSFFMRNGAKYGSVTLRNARIGRQLEGWRRVYTRVGTKMGTVQRTRQHRSPQVVEKIGS